MTRIEYITQLEQLLREARMAPKDLEDASARCSQFILNGGPEREEETIAGMEPPEVMAAQILEDYRSTQAARRGSVSAGRKIFLGLLLSPFIVAAYGTVLGLVVGGAACIPAGIMAGLVGLGALLSGGLGTLLTFAGGGLLTVGVGLVLLAAGAALCQGSNWCMRRLFGGRRAAV